jgi:imidazole glycerol-phosphate synthase subunit HisH
MKTSKKKVIIIDYHMSNLFSVMHACDYLGLRAEISSEKKDIEKADGIILPGVGAYGDAMKNLQRLDLLEPLKAFVQSGKPFMGVCLGMQLLFTESEEFGNSKGLGIIKGNVIRFPMQTKKNETVKVPHIGWNTIYPSSKANWKESPYKNIKENEFMYFVHSYYVSSLPKDTILSLTTYGGIEYCSSVLSNNVFATQFHPEKSGNEGIKIYKAWAEGL